MSPGAAIAAESLSVIDARGVKLPHAKLDDRLTPSQRVELLQWLEENEETYVSARARLIKDWGVEGISERMLKSWHQARRVSIAKRNLAEQAEGAREIVLARSDAESVEEAVVATLISRALEVTQSDNIKPSHYREIVGLVVRLREQNIAKERLKLERARFELDVADLVLKHIDKLKDKGVLQTEDRQEAARMIRETIFGKITAEQAEASALAVA